MQSTIVYNDDAKGWTSRFSYIPDWLCKLNNRFFSIKDGQLWLHNDENNNVRNNFYGVQHSSSITTVINEENSEDKIFKTLVLESNKPWSATIKTRLSESTIKVNEFNQRESRWFSHIRKNENANDFHGNAAIGIGLFTNVNVLLLTLTVYELSDLICVDDQVYQINGNTNELIGTIVNINGNVLTLNSFNGVTIVPNAYNFATKNARIEGSEIRGHSAEITLVNNENTPVELFAIESNIVKSYV